MWAILSADDFLYKVTQKGPTFIKTAHWGWDPNLDEKCEVLIMRKN